MDDKIVFTIKAESMKQGGCYIFLSLSSENIDIVRRISNLNGERSKYSEEEDYSAGTYKIADLLEAKK